MFSIKFTTTIIKYNVSIGKYTNVGIHPVDKVANLICVYAGSSIWTHRRMIAIGYKTMTISLGRVRVHKIVSPTFYYFRIICTRHLRELVTIMAKHAAAGPGGRFVQYTPDPPQHRTSCFFFTRPA